MKECTVLVCSQFIDQWKKNYASEIWCENVRTKEKKRLWRRKNSTQPFAYPWKEQRTTTPPQNWLSLLCMKWCICWVLLACFHLSHINIVIMHYQLSYSRTAISIDDKTYIDKDTDFTGVSVLCLGALFSSVVQQFSKVDAGNLLECRLLGLSAKVQTLRGEQGRA